MGVREVTAAATQPCEIEAKHAEPGLYQRTRNIGGRFRVFGARETVCEDSPRSWQSVWFIKPCSQQMAEAPGKFNFKASHVSLKLIRMQDSNRGRCDSRFEHEIYSHASVYYRLDEGLDCPSQI